MRRKYVSGLLQILVIFASAILAGQHSAFAACNIASASIASVATASIGTYSPPTALPSVAVSVTINLTYAANANGTCAGGVAFARTGSATGSLSRVGGGSTIPYTLTNSGGANVLFLAGGTPAQSAFAAFSNQPNVTQVTVSFVLQGSPTPANLTGSYSDTLTLAVYNTSGNAVIGTSSANTAFTITGTVGTSCSITAGSLQNKTQTIGVSSTGLTTGMTTPSPIFNVTCSNSSTASLTTLNGAVTRGGGLETALGAISGFRNKIEYSASMNGGAGAITLNTASASIANGTFNAAAISDRAITVTITPEASATPLQAGTYADTLRIVITPN